MYDLDGRKAIVTGGGSGIGRATALRLAREGCDVGIFDLDAEGARASAAEVEAAGRRAQVAVGDVGDRDQAQAGMAALVAALGQVDVLVNCAGILRIGTVLEMSERDWTDTFRVNVDGVLWCTRAVVPAMVARRAGKVINVASWLGKKGVPHYGAYCASKFAVVALTQSLALEVASRGVTVNAVCPGLIVDTGMRREAEVMHERHGLPRAAQRLDTIPLGRHGLPQDVARIIAFLASDESSYLTGDAINVTGGLWMH